MKSISLAFALTAGALTLPAFAQVDTIGDCDPVPVDVVVAVLDGDCPIPPLGRRPIRAEPVGSTKVNAETVSTLYASPSFTEVTRGGWRYARGAVREDRR